MEPTSNVVLWVELLVGPVDADTVEMPPVRQLSVEDWVEKKRQFIIKTRTL